MLLCTLMRQNARVHTHTHCVVVVVHASTANVALCTNFAEFCIVLRPPQPSPALPSPKTPFIYLYNPPPLHQPSLSFAKQKPAIFCNLTLEKGTEPTHTHTHTCLGVCVCVCVDKSVKGSQNLSQPWCVSGPNRAKNSQTTGRYKNHILTQQYPFSPLQLITPFQLYSIARKGLYFLQKKS